MGCLGRLARSLRALVVLVGSFDAPECGLPLPALLEPWVLLDGRVVIVQTGCGWGLHMMGG